MYKRLLSFSIWMLLFILCDWPVQGKYVLPERREQTDNLYFVENVGQVKDQFHSARPDIDFRLSDNRGIQVFIGNGAIHYQWIKPNQNATYLLQNPKDAKNLAKIGFESYRMDVRLVGARKMVRPEATQIQTYYESYMLNKGKGTIARSYQKITYREVYPHIDWILYIRDNRLEYDFVVHPGGKVSDIQIQYGGASSLSINPDGSLTAQTPMGSINEAAPYSFQEDGLKINSRFVLNGNNLSFQTASYEGVLTIDPKLDWATYYGGPGIFMTTMTQCDPSGNVYLGGHTFGASDIVTTGAYQDTFGGGLLDGFLVKFNSSGARLWATYIGGEGIEMLNDIICDYNNNVYVAGFTQSVNGIATAGSHKANKSAAIDDADAFLIKLDSSGNRIWGTYFGGEEGEGEVSVTCDHSGNVYLTCTTGSTAEIATPGCHQPSPSFNVLFTSCLAKFNSSGVRQWGTYYDGYLTSVAADSTGVYIGGEIGFTGTPGIATPGCYQDTFGGGVDLYLARFNSDGVRIWGTYYGGTGGDNQGYRMLCLDQNSNIYLAGTTTSRDTIGGMLTLATPGCHQPQFGGGYNDLFIAKFNKEGKRIWGTYYGGNGFEFNPGVICDNGGRLYLIGYTSSTTSISTPGAYQDTLASSNFDGFLVQLDTSGKRLWSTYYGGSDDDFLFSAHNDPYGNIYIAGTTTSANGIATPNGFRSQYAGQGAEDGFLTKFCNISYFPYTIEGKDTVCDRENIYSIAFLGGASYHWSLPPGWTGYSDSNSISVQAGAEGGIISVSVMACGDTVARKTMNVYIPSLDPEITVNGFELGTTRSYQRYQWLLNGRAIPDATHSKYTVQENGAYQVITDIGSCSDTSPVYNVTNYTGIDNSLNDLFSVSIYPNPTMEKVYIQSHFPVRAKVSGLDGRLLIQTSSSQVVDLSHLPAGCYILHVFDSDQTPIKTFKLVKSQ